MADKPIQPAKAQEKPTPETEPTPKLERPIKYGKPEFKPEKKENLPPLSNDGRPQSTMQKIERVAALPPGAADALGGPPLMAPIGKPAARAPQAPAPVEIPRTGNATFDPPSPEVIERRQSIAIIKSGVINLLSIIKSTSDQIRPHLEKLSINSEEVKQKEDFDTQEVKDFLNELNGSIDNLNKK